MSGRYYLWSILDRQGLSGMTFQTGLSCNTCITCKTKQAVFYEQKMPQLDTLYMAG